MSKEANMAAWAEDVVYHDADADVSEDAYDAFVAEEHEVTSQPLMVSVRADDLRAVLKAANYVDDIALRGPVDRMGDALALARIDAEEAK